MFAFLAPVFLAGLAALAVPILIHLSSRPRKRQVEFPSLMFLERVEYQDSSKRRLRNIVLFALRSLALILVAAAFARPFLDRADAPVAAVDGGREVVILLDRSGSMGIGDRLDEAKEAVDAQAATLRRGDRATLVVFDQGAGAANRATDQPAVLRGAADTVAAGDGGTRLGPALRLAESILVGSPLPRRELMVISDFQRTAWDPDAAARMPAGTEIRTVAVGAPVANGYVADVRFGRERFSGRDRVRVAAAVAHTGDGSGEGGEGSEGGEGGEGGAEGTDVPVELVLDGRVIQTRTVAVPPNGAATVEFDPVTLGDDAIRGTVRAGSDAFPDDNAFHFVLNASRALRVVVIGSRGSGDPADPYLDRALTVSPDVQVTTATGLAGVDLGQVDVVVLNGADPEDRLAGFVAAGGGVVAVLGERSRARTWAEVGLLPGSLEGTRDAEGAALSALQSEHPVLRPFRGAGTGGLTAARFYRYRVWEPAPGADVLARFDDGSPALAVAGRGQGRVAVLSSSLDGSWNDLVLQPGFVPLTHELVRYVAGREPGPAWQTVGELLNLAELAAGPDTEPDSAATDAGARSVLLTPSDRPVPVDGVRTYTLRERGFYEFRDPRATEAVPVAVNGDPAESRTERVDPEVVTAAVSGGAAVASASFAPEDQERRQALWWYFLAGAFILMVAETALSNGLSRRPLPTNREGKGR